MPKGRNCSTSPASCSSHRETYPVTESDLERLDDGELIAVRPDGWVCGQLDQLNDIREDIDRARKREREGWLGRISDRPSGWHL